ncbi:unnamed protein product [Alternaria alternata]
MSKLTLGLIAAGGAAAGAAATAALYSTKKDSLPPTPSITTTTTTVTGPGRPAPVPSVPAIPSPAAAAAARRAIVDPNGLFQYGFPGPVNDLRPAASLTSSYDRRTRNPAWVAEHITPESLANSNADRKHSVFVEDITIPEMFRAKLKDYFRSGYDRGHQVPAADAKWSQEAMDDTFALSNMLTHSYPSVRIVTGPLYLPKREADGKWRVSYEVIGNPPNVAVPTHFYKVIFAEDGRLGGKVALGAFVLPNARIENHKPLTDFEVPVEAVERASGLEFATKLTPERRKRLCQEVNCSVIVKEYAQRQKTFAKK